MSIVCYALAMVFMIVGTFDNYLEPFWGDYGPELYEPYLLGIFWMLCAIYLRQRETKE